MSYITADAITDRFINRDGTKLYGYLVEADNELERLAQQKGVRNTDEIDTDDDGYITDHTIKRYLSYYVQYRFCQDRIGVSGSDNGLDDYYIAKKDDFKKELDEYRTQITREMITGDINETGDTALSSGYIFRG